MLGLPEREQDLIHTAALLHDIGKFIFPDSILFADRKLTDEEWETVKLHPEQGAKLVRRIEGYGPVADIIYCHHERYDGNGYYKVPLEQIPLGSRIIAAADTYDVMTSRDSYRRPVSSEAALAELRRVAGSQLDPIVVETFETMILERGIASSTPTSPTSRRELAFERRVEDYARPRVGRRLDTCSIKRTGRDRPKRRLTRKSASWRSSQVVCACRPSAETHLAPYLSAPACGCHRAGANRFPDEAKGTGGGALGVIEHASNDGPRPARARPVLVLQEPHPPANRPATRSAPFRCCERACLQGRLQNCQRPTNRDTRRRPTFVRVAT